MPAGVPNGVRNLRDALPELFPELIHFVPIAEIRPRSRPRVRAAAAPPRIPPAGAGSFAGCYSCPFTVTDLPRKSLQVALAASAHGRSAVWHKNTCRSATRGSPIIRSRLRTISSSSAAKKRGGFGLWFVPDQLRPVLIGDVGLLDQDRDCAHVFVEGLSETPLSPSRRGFETGASQSR